MRFITARRPQSRLAAVTAAIRPVTTMVQTIALVLSSAVAAHAADLEVTVRNIAAGSTCDPGPPQGGAYIVRYTAGGSYLDDRITDGNGVATWTGIGTSTYRFDVFSAGAELWRREMITVESGSNSVELVREEPRVTDFGVSAEGTDVTGGNVDPGTPLLFEVVVRNCANARTVRTTLRVDRDQQEPWDFEQRSDPDWSTGGFFPSSFEFTHAFEAAGVYRRQWIVETEIDDLWMLTHYGSWATAVTVGPVGCPEDTNLDGQIDADDLVNVILDWGTDGSANNTDVDGNGVVNTDDLVTVILAWGPCG
jgi:hypothetical protein